MIGKKNRRKVSYKVWISSSILIFAGTNANRRWAQFMKPNTSVSVLSPNSNVRIQSHNQKIGTIPNGTPSDGAEGVGTGISSLANQSSSHWPYEPQPYPFSIVFSILTIILRLVILQNTMVDTFLVKATNLNIIRLRIEYCILLISWINEGLLMCLCLVVDLGVYKRNEKLISVARFAGVPREHGLVYFSWSALRARP